MVVVQCPPRIEPSSGSVENLRGLFSTVEGGDCEVAWEPRGEWLDELELVEDLCEELNPVHCVELLGREPFHVTDTAYVRLHGLNEDPYDYDYNYTHDELE